MARNLMSICADDLITETFDLPFVRIPSVPNVTREKMNDAYTNR